MELTRYVEISGLTPPQKHILERYRSHLNRPRSSNTFDSSTANLMREYLVRPEHKQQFDELLEQVKHIEYYPTYDPSQIEDQISSFCEPNHPSFTWNRWYKEAKKAMIEEFSSARLKMVQYHSDKDVELYLPKKGTHAGYPYLETGKKQKGEYLEDVLVNLTKREQQAIQDGSFKQPIMIGSRLQLGMPFDEDFSFTGKFKKKTRLVSMISIWQILAERKFQYPIQKWMSTKEWYAGGKSDNAISAIMTRTYASHDEWVCLDYSKFDQSISAWLIDDAFEIMRAGFDDRNFDENLFNVVKHDFIIKKFIDGKGNLRHSEKGVPSGSMFTQIIDSIVNRLMINTYLRKLSLTENSDYRMCIMGDDNIIFFHRRVHVDIEDLCSYLSRNFGIITNPDKLTSGSKSKLTRPEFLSRVWQSSGPWRHFKEIVVKMCYPERYRAWKDMDAEPVHVLYSYLQAYRGSFNEFFDIHRFSRDYPFSSLEQQVNEIGYVGMSGYWAYIQEYSDSLVSI